MKTNIEYCDPFDGEPENFWMKIEHCGRYLWAAERLSGEGCQSVADIACATGYGSRILSEKINQVIGIDRSTDYIERARRSTREGHIRYLCLDLNQSQLAQKLSDIDAVVCFETLEHLQHPLKALQEFHQCLRAKGLLLLSVPNERYEQLDENGQNLDPFHLHIFSPDDVKNLLEQAGFSILETLGQDICNRIVTRISKQDKAGLLSKEQAEKMWPHDEAGIRMLSRIFGCPDAKNPEESYSYLYVCQKKELQ